MNIAASTDGEFMVPDIKTKQLINKSDEPGMGYFVKTPLSNHNAQLQNVTILR